ALLTRMSSSSKRSLVARASSAAPSGVEMSPGIAWQSPICASSVAAALTSSALREETITRAPACTRPRAIISPIPREPPVTSAVLPDTSNRSLIAARAYRSPAHYSHRDVRPRRLPAADRPARAPEPRAGAPRPHHLNPLREPRPAAGRTGVAWAGGSAAQAGGRPQGRLLLRAEPAAQGGARDTRRRGRSPARARATWSRARRPATP